MRLMPLISATLIFSMSGSLSAQEWMEYANREDHFTCIFPGQPKIETKTYRSEYGADLPSRIYSVAQGESRYSVTVVDYNPLQRILTEKSKSCPPGDVVCIGTAYGSGEGWWKVDLKAAIVYASWQYMQRAEKVTQYQWNFLELVEGHQLVLTNSDKSRSYVGIYMHENKLFIIDGTVPAGSPEPGWFPQSFGWLDENGAGIRYLEIYSNGYPAPPHINPEGRIEASGTTGGTKPQ